MAATRGVGPERHPSPGSGNDLRVRRPLLGLFAQKNAAKLGERCGRVLEHGEDFHPFGVQQPDAVNVAVDGDPDALPKGPSVRLEQASGQAGLPSLPTAKRPQST